MLLYLSAVLTIPTRFISIYICFTYLALKLNTPAHEKWEIAPHALLEISLQWTPD